jgi:molybdate transport system substrate-binding protein
VNAVAIKVLSTHAAFEMLGELGPRFERTAGHRLSIDYDPANVIKRHIDGGAVFDVAIVTRPVIDDLAAQGKIIPATCIDIGRSGLGVAVRKGAPKPDIGTIEAFKHTLLAAKSVVRSKDGTSGLYFEKLLDRLGIAEAMRGKLVLAQSGRVAELVARGEAEMAVQQIAELLPVTGAEFVGPFPPQLQLYTVFAAGVGTAAKEPEAGKTLISALAAPAAAALFTAKGLEPIRR